MPAIINVNTADAMLDLIRTEFRNLQLRELLHRPPDVLLGVSRATATVLKSLEINTVFDLATSVVFDAATKLLNAGTNLKSALYQHGSPTADLVREADAAGKKIAELQFLPIRILENIPTEEVVNVQNALDVQTVRDLALYPPYRAAVRLLNAVYFPENASDFDPERPADLLPKSGEFPTERVQYTTLFMDKISVGPDDQFVDLESSAFRPIDISRLALADAGFKKVAFGALLTMNQSWFAQGVTLGQLLHSVALAPGESTRIAVIDWSRKSRAGETEVVSEADELINDTSRNRSITEVTGAVANEAQGGFSGANTSSQSVQTGTSEAVDSSGGFFEGTSRSGGGTSSTANTSAQSDGYSLSFGHRDIGSTLMQDVNDRTHQHAHSSRSRRASVVKEVSQTEHEAVSTRVLANYNHMHALTVQYYEVVQVYRTEVAVAKADKVVFIPIALIDFDNEDTIRRFRNVLALRGLTVEIREALRNLDVVAIKPDTTTHFSALNGNLALFLKDAVLTRSRLHAAPVVAPAASTAGELTIVPTTVQFSARVPVLQQANAHLWSSDQVSRLSNLIGSVVLRHNSNAIFLPTDAIVEGAVATGNDKALDILFHRRQGDTTSTVNAEAALPMTDISRIALKGSSDRDISVTITLTLNRNGVRFPLELPAVRIAANATAETPVVTIEPGGVNVNLKQHLNANKLYYSQIVYRSLDSTQIALLLSGFALKVGGNTVPVSQVIEPNPIRYVGNYLAFKMISDPENDEAWSKFLKTRGIHLGVTKEDIVPLATGGTFAEAVLGRFNCAEKLDITRFWNWQDSPIPLQPTEIAAIQTGSRATNEDVKPGQLSNPIINITSPTALPDPTGTSAILAAIQNGNMFRDMSGLQATIGLTQAALQATSAGAATAGQQAGTNMNSLLQANTERRRIAAEMITSLARTAAAVYTGGAVSAGGGISGGGGSHSQDGAKINYFDKTRGQTPSGGSNARSGAVVPVGGVGQSGGDAGGGAGTGGSSTNGAEDGGFSQNPGALAATWGDGEPRSALFRQVVDRAGADGAGGLITDPVLITGSLTPTNTAFPSGGQRLCFPVSAFQTPQFASGFGTIAERLIEQDYCDTLGCPPTTTYVDNNNATAYRAFLVAHNPALATGPMAAKLAAKFPAVSRPDILCDDGARRDFYEIKPLSPTGAAEGVVKLVSIAAFMSELQLPYVAGTVYTPSKDIPIMSGSVLGSNIGISLNVQRFVPGIITYTICLNGELAALLSKVALAALLAWIATQLLFMVGGALVVA
jgi:hypothetical protein